jgi:DNA-binding SARP family transcriptional activator
MFVEFAILGPISVRVDGHEVGLGTDTRRTLLALLILQANRPVKTEQLLEVLGEGPRPPSAVHSHIAQLRKLFGTERLRTVAGGYQLNIPEGELDATIFEEEVGRARDAMARGDAAAAAAELERALGRWRGPALADAGGAEWAIAEARRLDELHGRAQEMLLDAKLAMGQPDAAVGLAQMAIERHPLQESLWAYLLLALYRSGRRADAVRAYQQVRARLETECSRMPSAELTKLERAILLQDPGLGDASRWTKILTPGPSSTVVTAAERVLPGGVVTFLMTDVVGSTRLWETAPAAMREALARHDELMKIAVESHEGVLLRERGEGDSTFSVFRRATDGATAALAAQLSLTREPWPPGCVISVRMAMHTGEASERDGDYYGRAVNRVARLRAIAEGGQILVGQSAAEILLDHLPAATGLVSLGVRELRDFDRPENVYVLGGPFGEGPRTIEIPVTAPGPASAPRPFEGAPAAARWKAVVDADREYHDRSADSDVQFPDDVQPRVIPLTEPTMLIGRRTPSRGIEPGIDLSEPREDPGVSRRHAVLERQPDGSYSLTDPGSTNGTFLNEFDKPIPPEVPIALRSGDRIYLGAWTRIEIRSESE